MKIPINKQVGLLFLIFFGWSTQGITMEKPITKEYKLDNGLKIVVREDHRAPVVVSQIWYKVGSAKEYRGITGVSHALEHMMFQGTPNLPGDSFSKLISKHGGRDNAFTAEDYTAYYEELDASNLAISFSAEAERMAKLTLSQDAFDKEIQVIMEERRMRTDDNPQSLTSERFMAVAFPKGPYHHPIIGWQSDLDIMNATHLRDWYEKWYAPNNATLVVVGAVKSDEVFALAKQYFAAIPKRALPPGPPQQELSPLGEKRIKVHVKANLPYVIWGFSAPSLKTAKDEKEAYALWVASALLDGGESSRFSRELIRGQQVAAGVSAHYDLLKEYDTQFIITGVPAGQKTVAMLEESVMAQLEKLKKEPVSEEELNRVKTQLLAQEIFEKDSMAEQATILGVLESVGLSWSLADQFIEKIKAVTPAEIQQAAIKYFNPVSLTVAELIPEKLTH